MPYYQERDEVMDIDYEVTEQGICPKCGAKIEEYEDYYDDDEGFGEDRGADFTCQKCGYKGTEEYFVQVCFLRTIGR